MAFTIFIMILSAILLSLTKTWRAHLGIFGSFYLIMIVLWIWGLWPKSYPEGYHRGDPLLGLGLITLFTAPILVLTHIIILIKNYLNQNDKRVFYLHLSGLLIALATAILFTIESGILR